MKPNRGSKQVRHLLWIIGLSILLAACGGGGGGGGFTSASQGVFLDSAVEGIRYETPTQSGTTDASGTFRYMTGEMVEFFAGDISLGSVAGAATLTPIDLVSGAVDETNEHVTNILRFLQSLDDDMDPSNVIRISPAYRTALMGQTLNFAQAMAAFESDFNALSGAVLSSRSLVSAADAQAHMRATLDAMTGGGSSGGGSTGGGSTGGGSGGGGQGLGSVTVSGADTSTIGSSYAPTIVGSSTVQTATAVNWIDAASTTVGLSAIGNELASLTFVASTASAGGGGISIRLYTYNISCWPVAAAECSKITLDIAGKRLVLSGAQLAPTPTVISTNYATAPITLEGTLYWE